MNFKIVIDESGLSENFKALKSNTGNPKSYKKSNKEIKQFSKKIACMMHSPYSYLIVAAQKMEKYIKECEVLYPEKINHKENIQMFAAELNIHPWVMSFFKNTTEYNTCTAIAFKYYYDWLSGSTVDEIQLQWNLLNLDLRDDGLPGQKFDYLYEIDKKYGHLILR